MTITIQPLTHVLESTSKVPSRCTQVVLSRTGDRWEIDVIMIDYQLGLRVPDWLCYSSSAPENVLHLGRLI